MKDKFQEIKQKAEQLIAEGAETIQNIQEASKEKVEQVIADNADTIQNIQEASKEKVEQVIAKSTETIQNIQEASKEKVEQVIADNADTIQNIQDVSKEKVEQVIAKSTEKLDDIKSSLGQFDLLSILNKVLADPLQFKDKIMDKLHEIKTNMTDPVEEMTKDELQKKVAEQIIASYSELAATSGDILNLTNIIPGAFLATMPTGITLFVKFSTELVMTMATVYGLDITEDKYKDLCLVLYISGALQEEKAVITPENIETYLQTVDSHYAEGYLKDNIKNSFNTFGKILTRKGIVNINNASSEFSINKGFAIFLGKQVNNFFQTHYDSLKEKIDNPNPPTPEDSENSKDSN